MLISPDLKGKRIIVTGASQGLGAIAAQSYTKGGAKVALLARQKDKLNAVRDSLQNKDEHVVVEVDLLENQMLPAAITKATEALGGVDVLLHAAGGGLGFRDPLLSHEELMKLFQ